MIRRRNGQRGLWDVLRFGDLEPEKQMDPRLRRIDEVLEDGALVDGVLDAMRSRFPQSKEPIVIRDVPGFATSRLGALLGAEAIRMLETGVATATEIDLAMELGYRHPMGPLKLSDLVGLDVRLAILERLHAELCDQFRPPALLRQMVRAGRLGKKTGIGFYLWDGGSP